MVSHKYTIHAYMHLERERERESFCELLTVRTGFDSNPKTGMDSSPNNKFVESGRKI